MKNCPSCDFLMGDDQSICSSCAEAAASASPFIDASPIGVSGVGPETTGTAVLDRPLVAPLSDSVRYRSRGGSRSTWRLALVLVVLLGALGALGFMGARGDGPLAEPMVSMGLVSPPVVTVPEVWTSSGSEAGGFTAVLPIGAEEVDRQIDPLDPAKGRIAGFTVPLGEQGVMMALSTDFGLGPAGMDALDNDPEFAALIDRFATAALLGTETVRREAPVGDGRAADVVFVLDDDTTTRARFRLVDDRFFALLTTGSDAGAEQLDAAHPRLVDGFESTG